MSDGTPIEWTDATWNPVSGCTKVSQGCKNCYAERLWPKVAGAEAKRTGEPARAFTEVRCHPDRLDIPLRWRKPRRIFVNSMSDLFHEDVPDEFIDRVFAVMGMCQRHTFQVLTKRPERMRAYLNHFNRAALIGGAQFAMASANPRMRVDGYTGLTHTRLPMGNVQCGVSVEDNITAAERIPLLLGTPAAVRFVSYEPALGPVYWNEWLLSEHGRRQIGAAPGISWLIAGGESGPGARPAHPDWFRLARDQCAAAGVPFLFKQWGNFAPVKEASHDDKPFGYQPVYGVKPNGESLIHTEIYDPEVIPFPKGMWWMKRVTKKEQAGRMLDGREHTDFPTMKEAACRKAP